MPNVTLKRVFRSGYLSFRRNGWLSTATVMVMVMVLFVMGSILVLGAFAGTVLEALESKIDISVYFVADAADQDIIAVQKEIESLADVESAAYVSRDEALERFRETHKANALITDALSELGENPLQASLNIKARNPSNYSGISEFLLNKNYAAVDKINYFENQKVIDRLGMIVGTVRGTGLLLVLFLTFIAVLVAFNTIRLAIYTMREEIGIMRLVGATKWFVRGPFLVSGVLYGLSAGIATAIIFFPLTWLLAPKLSALVPQFDLFAYFLANFWQFLTVMIVAGIALGAISSFIAVRRYLEA